MQRGECLGIGGQSTEKTCGLAVDGGKTLVTHEDVSGPGDILDAWENNIQAHGVSAQL